MEKNYLRKILFLYPDLWDIEDDLERKKITTLTTDLQYVVDSANLIMSDILMLGHLNSKTCIPMVEMKSIRKTMSETSKHLIVDEESDYKYGLRICLTKFDDEHDYKDLYIKILNEIEPKDDISHLISVNINEKGKKVKWKSLDNNNSPFDVEVESTLDTLKNVILSMMLDISMYYSFGLKEEYEYRKSFCTLKKEFIFNSFDNETINKIFGNNLEKLKAVDFLPLSYCFIDKILKDNENTKECMKKFERLIITKVIGTFSIENDEISFSSTYYNDKSAYQICNQYKNMIIEEYDSIENKDNLILVLLDPNCPPKVKSELRKLSLISTAKHKFITEGKFSDYSIYFPFFYFYKISEVV